MSVLRLSALAALLAAGCQAGFVVSVPAASANVTLGGDSSSVQARLVAGVSLPGILFNALAFVSGEASATDANVQASVLVGFTAAPGLLGNFFPAVTLVSATGNAQSSLNGLGDLLKGVVTGSPINGVVTGTVKAEASASAMTQIYYSLIEFNDANGNNKVDSDESIVQTIRLDTINYETTKSGNDNGILHNAVTSTGSFKGLTLQSYVSIKDNVRVSSGKIVTPRSISTDVYINNFPYKGTGTKLALRTYVVGITAKADASSNFKLTTASSSALATSGDGKIGSVFSSWASDAKAQASGNSADATADTSGSIIGVVTTVSGGNKTEIKGSLDLDAVVNGGAKADLSVVDYVFNSVQPAAIFFDPTIGAGGVIGSSAPQLAAFSSVAALFASVVSAVALML